MLKRVNIKDIKVQWLNARCLNIMAKYAKLAHETDETIIMVSSDSCLSDIVSHANNSNSQEIKWVYDELKGALRDLLSTSRLQTELKALESIERVNQNNHTENSFPHYSN